MGWQSALLLAWFSGWVLTLAVGVRLEVKRARMEGRPRSLRCPADPENVVTLLLWPLKLVGDCGLLYLLARLERYGEQPAQPRPPAKPCPYCGEPLATDRARQCFACGTDWHDPDRVVGRGR